MRRTQSSLGRRQEGRRRQLLQLARNSALFIRRGTEVCGLIQHRRYLWSTYPNAMVGTQIVEFLMTFSLAETREEAVALGEALVVSGFLSHVLGRHSFKDKYLFYKWDDARLASLRSSLRDSLSDMDAAMRPSVLGARVSDRATASVAEAEAGMVSLDTRLGGESPPFSRARVDSGGTGIAAAASTARRPSPPGSPIISPAAWANRLTKIEVLADLYVEQNIFVDAAKLYAYALSLRSSARAPHDPAGSPSHQSVYYDSENIACRRLLVRLFYVEFAYVRHVQGTMRELDDSTDPATKKRLKMFRAAAYAAFEGLTRATDADGAGSSTAAAGSSPSPSPSPSRSRSRSRTSSPSPGSSPCAMAVRSLARSREALRLARCNAVKMLADGGSPSDVSVYSADTVISIFSNMVNDGVAALGPPPVAFALAVVGDLASRNVALYPRIDFVVIIESDEDDTAASYFHTLSTLLYLKVIGLGETQVKVFGTQRNEFGCTFGLFTPVHFPNEALGTPLKLATLLLTGSTFAGPPPGSSGGSSPMRSPLSSPGASSEISFGVPCVPPGAVDYSVFTRSLYPMRLVAGDPRLVDAFRGLVDTVLSSPLADLSYSALRVTPARPVTPMIARPAEEVFVKGSVVRHVLAAAMIREAVHALDARRNAVSGAVSVSYVHARPLVWDALLSLVHGVAFYFEVGLVDSTWVAIEQLTGQGVLSAEFAEALSAALNAVYELRVRLAHHYACGRELASSSKLANAHAQRVGMCVCGCDGGMARPCALGDVPFLAHSPVYELDEAEMGALEAAVHVALILAAELERLVSGVLPYSTPLLGNSAAGLLSPNTLGHTLLAGQTWELLHAFSSANKAYAKAAALADTSTADVEARALSAWLAWRQGRVELARLSDGLTDCKAALEHLQRAAVDLDALEGMVGEVHGAATDATWLVWSLLGLYSRPAIHYARALVYVHIGIAAGLGGDTALQGSALKDALGLLTSLSQGDVSAAARTYSAVGLWRALITVYGSLGRVELDAQSLTLASSYLTSALNRVRSSSVRVSCPSPHGATAVESYGMSFSEASAAAGLAPFVDGYLSLLFGTMSDLMAARNDYGAAKDYAARGVEIQEHHLRRDGVPHAALGEHYVQMGLAMGRAGLHAEALDWFGWAMQVFERVYAALLVTRETHGSGTGGGSGGCELQKRRRFTHAHVAMARVHVHLADTLYQLGYFEVAEKHYGYVVQGLASDWRDDGHSEERAPGSAWLHLVLLLAKAQEATGAICNILERFEAAHAAYLGALDAYAEALRVIPSGDQVYEKRRSAVELDCGRCQFNTGFVCKSLGKGSESGTHFEAAHTTFVSVLGATHPDTVLARQESRRARSAPASAADSAGAGPATATTAVREATAQQV